MRDEIRRFEVCGTVTTCSSERLSFFPSSFTSSSRSRRWLEREEQIWSSACGRFQRLTLFPLRPPSRVFLHRASAPREISGLLTPATRLSKISRMEISLRTTFMSLSLTKITGCLSNYAISLEFVQRTFDVTDQKERFILTINVKLSFHQWNVYKHCDKWYFNHG